MHRHRRVVRKLPKVPLVHGVSEQAHRPARDNDKWVRFNADGTEPSTTVYACTICKVRLCPKCFRMEDDDGNPLLDSWDHDDKCLLARPCESVWKG